MDVVDMDSHVDIPRYTEEEVDAYKERLVQQIPMVHEKVGTTY